jgi:hypothetical protein
MSSRFKPINLIGQADLSRGKFIDDKKNKKFEIFLGVKIFLTKLIPAEEID